MAEHQSDAASGKTLQCVVVTPERSVLDVPAEFVALPMFDGELGVAPGRAPLIGRLGIGELRVRHAGHVTRLFIDGGFAQIRANVVTVLTPSAMTAEEIKPDVVRESLAAAKAQKATKPHEAEARDKAQQRARAKLRLKGERAGRAAH